jgi:hypothetical protein
MNPYEIRCQLDVPSARRKILSRLIARWALKNNLGLFVYINTCQIVGLGVAEQKAIRGNGFYVFELTNLNSSALLDYVSMNCTWHGGVFCIFASDIIVLDDLGPIVKQSSNSERFWRTISDNVSAVWEAVDEELLFYAASETDWTGFVTLARDADFSEIQ